ncbi:Tetratrico peptide repeat-containing protein [Agrococcus baldri]|uniref:Tetratrico peptide repeat-containing protein n=1 Tax=Agrococcus baldri TaxID=153730 RepID=A0AA94HKP1_9MICO|nr:tetratricopeptide repeat protein [Agrococcus baldri]SFR99248.1 Tetratrico peptide repeat-containing protein [Agrococcus baldri]
MSGDWQARADALWERLDQTPRDAAVAEMQQLADAYPGTDGRGAFELAGMYDSNGFEQEAEREYERALALGLEPEQHAQLAVQYGSTLRNTGRLDEAIAVLEAAPTHPSTGAAPRVFLALALHTAGRHDEAMRVVVEAIEPTLPRYNRSVRAYAVALTEPED